VREILVQFNEEEYKTVPILSTPEAVRYLMSQEGEELRTITQEGAHLHKALSGVEGTVLEQVRLLQLNLPALSGWCKDVKIKHLEALGILQASLLKRRHLLSNPLEAQPAVSFLAALEVTPLLEGQSLMEQGMRLWRLFRPSAEMSVNVSYHLKNELAVRYFKELMGSDRLFLQKYEQLADIRYSGYRPAELEAIEDNLKSCEREAGATQKLLVYRGHDNLESLIDFY
jgi:hypothetical protein